MLFHLKEPDYKVEAPNDTKTRIYSRDPEQIIGLVKYYMEREKLDRSRSDLAWWIKKDPTLDDIEEVERGEFYFFTGMIKIGAEYKDKAVFDQEIKVSPEFSVFVPEENIGNFAWWKTDMEKRKRADLYKLQSPIEMFRNLSFVPEDIAMAVKNCDLTHYLDSMRKEIEERENLSQHPNLKVDGLQRMLKARDSYERKQSSQRN